MIGGPLSARAAVLRETGWATSFDSYDGTLVAHHPDPSTGIRIIGRSGEETIARIRALPSVQTVGTLGDELAGALIDRDGLALQLADLERRTGTQRRAVVVAPDEPEAPAAVPAAAIAR